MSSLTFPVTLVLNCVVDGGVRGWFIIGDVPSDGVVRGEGGGLVVTPQRVEAIGHLIHVLPLALQPQLVLPLKRV